MGNMTTAVIFVVVVNVLMFLTQAAMLDLNPDQPKIFNCEGTLMEERDLNACKGSYYQLDTDSASSDLPTAESSISPTTGNIFTDTFTSIKSWFTTKINFVAQILTAPYNLISHIPGVPNAFVFAIGTLWYTISLFCIIAFFWGER